MRDLSPVVDGNMHLLIRPDPIDLVQKTSSSKPNNSKDNTDNNLTSRSFNPQANNSLATSIELINSIPSLR